MPQVQDRGELWVWAICIELLRYANSEFDMAIKTNCLTKCREVITLSDRRAVSVKVMECMQRAENCFQAGFPEEGFDNLRGAIIQLSKRQESKTKRSQQLGRAEFAE